MTYLNHFHNAEMNYQLADLNPRAHYHFKGVEEESIANLLNEINLEPARMKEDTSASSLSPIQFRKGRLSSLFKLANDWNKRKEAKFSETDD